MKKEDKQKGREKPLKEYFQETPFFHMKQCEDGLFSFKNFIAVPFHCMILGVFFDLMLWFSQELIVGTNEKWLPEDLKQKWNLDIKMKPDDFRKRELEMLLKNYKKFETTLPAKMVKPFSSLCYWLKLAYWHEGQLQKDKYFQAKADFFSVCERKHAEFLKRINFHNIDHVILEIEESGPIPKKKENIGESFHQIMKSYKKHIWLPNGINIMMTKRHEDWAIRMLDVE